MFSKPARFYYWLLFAFVLVGCSSKTSCLQEVAQRPGMTCMDVGLGWYHFQFASQAPLNAAASHPAVDDRTSLTAPAIYSSQ
jgi:PBP1b-binding outer membrane lipoprotein LpoB